MADEVSAQAVQEQPKEEPQPSEQQREPEAQPPQEPAPEKASQAELSEEVADEKEPAEPPVQESSEESEEPSAPRQEPFVHELKRAAGQLKALSTRCEKVLDATATLEYQGEVQDSLQEYSHHLKHLVSALQMLNDARRHVGDLQGRAGAVRKRLVAVRGGADDALSSEEARIIVAAAESGQTLQRIIGSLEALLSNIRSATQPLLALISYDKPGFAEFATDALRKVRVDIVSNVLRTEEQNIKRFAEDIDQLSDLEDHATELEDERAPEE